MKRNLRSCLILVAALGIAACADDPTSLINDTQVTADVAATSGDVIVGDVVGLIANEGFAGLPSAPSDLFASPASPPVDARTRTCFDAQDVQQAQCDPNTTAKVVLHWTIDGSRVGDRFTASVHRVRDLTISGLAGTETSRTHNGVGTSNDTITFAGELVTRVHAESSVDSVKNIVFNLPHANNPWPVSGSMVRRVSIHVTVTGENRSETRDANRRVEVTFPADGQGNVTINVNGKTCTLNLVTRVVNNCST